MVALQNVLALILDAAYSRAIRLKHQKAPLLLEGQLAEILDNETLGSGTWFGQPSWLADPLQLSLQPLTEGL
jgi:hypothetical protein